MVLYDFWVWRLTPYCFFFLFLQTVAVNSMIVVDSVYWYHRAERLYTFLQKTFILLHVLQLNEWSRFPLKFILFHFVAHAHKCLAQAEWSNERARDAACWLCAPYRTYGIFTRESSSYFLAIAIPSVRLSVTRVDQSKTVQARITKSSPSAA